MTLYRTADQAMSDYLRRLEAASHPRGVDPEGMVGRVYVDACLACGGEQWVAKGSAQICAGRKRNGRRCDRPRDFFPAALPAGLFDLHPRPGRFSDPLDELAQLGAILRSAGLWPSRLLALLVIGGTYDSAIREGRLRWPRRESGWSGYSVRQDVRTARRRVESGLSRAGLLIDNFAT